MSTRATRTQATTDGTHAEATEAISRHRGGCEERRACVAEIIEDWRAVAEELNLSDTDHAWLLAEDLLIHQEPTISSNWAADLAAYALGLSVNYDSRFWFLEHISELLCDFMLEHPVKAAKTTAAQVEK